MVAVTEMTNWAVDLIDVRKTYGRTTHALRGVNIQVGRGEIFGLLGPNGAGKSTLVKIMMTVVKPTRALGTILGRPVGHRGKLGVIGYLPEDHRFPHYLTGMQVLDYYAMLGKVPRVERRKRAQMLLDRVWLTQWAHRRTGEYSKGMLQRLGIAQALMNDPELVVLDEPTDGLDPVGRRDVRELLQELRDQRKTIFLNSHLLSELEMVCDRVSILVDGNVARQGTLSELTEHTQEYVVEIVGVLPSTLAPKAEAMGGRIDGSHIRLAGNDVDKVNELIDVLRRDGIKIVGVAPKRFSLEDVLVEAVGAPPSA
ncbi:MAG: ABC transporter ATP-binding protein [Phycisphaerae bacterium]